MCGIVGWLGTGLESGTAKAMLTSLRHRGPDDQGEWYEPDRRVWLGQRRLAIIDLTRDGHQPMISVTGRYVITYNGEVYNFPELRRDLVRRGHRFLGSSDTEVVLAAIEEFGVSRALESFVGMFAFAVYDRVEARLYLARDRMGVKPLYYACGEGRFAFASELKALQLVPWVDREIDIDALHAYLRYLCVPAPASILVGVRKLLPGHLLSWDGKKAELECYWDHRKVVHAGLADPFRGDFAAATDELDARLRDSIRMRMIADVPLGAFLSGGIDSSAVVSLMQAQSARAIKTFSIGFTEISHDESRYARAVAEHLGTDHQELILSPTQLFELLPKVAAFQDEPFADNSMFPTYLLAHFARQHVKVALSGDGGDELFGGYPRYFWADRIQGLRRRLGNWGASRLGRVLAASPRGLWDGPVTTLVGRRFGGADGLSARVARFAMYLQHSPERVYEDTVSVWDRPEDVLTVESANIYGPDLRAYANLSWGEGMMAVDQEHYLIDDIMAKVDRASMAVSLEAREPLLDHRLVEWSWRIPMSFKLAQKGDRGKLLLRAVLERYVPKTLIERPKQGFGMPVAVWLRAELREWAEALLFDTSLRKHNLLRPDVVSRYWRRHLEGYDHTARLWPILMFQQWYSTWAAECPAPTPV